MRSKNDKDRRAGPAGMLRGVSMDIGTFRRPAEPAPVSHYKLAPAGNGHSATATREQCPAAEIQ